MSAPAPAKAKKKYARQKRRAFKGGVGQVYSVRQGRWVWAYDAKVGGARVQDSGFSSREKALAALSALRLRALDLKYGLPSEETNAITLAALVAARKSDQTFKRLVSYKDAMRILENFCAYFPAEQSVTGLTTADVRAWLAAKFPHVSPGTINRYLIFVSGLLHSAGSHFPALASWKPPALPYAPPTEERNRPLALAEAHNLLAYLRTPVAHRYSDHNRRDVADAFQLALVTVMRNGEWLARRWSQIDFTLGVVHVTNTKTRKSRTVPLSPSARAILLRRFAERGSSEFVFPSPTCPARPRSLSSMRRLLRAAAEALKIPYGRKALDGFTPHDARHTAITNMLHAGNDLATIADISGHSKTYMTMRYAHASTASRHKALSSLEKFADAPEPEENHRTENEAKVET